MAIYNTSRKDLTNLLPLTINLFSSQRSDSSMNICMGARKLEQPRRALPAECLLATLNAFGQGSRSSSSQGGLLPSFLYFFRERKRSQKACPWIKWQAGWTPSPSTPYCWPFFSMQAGQMVTPGQPEVGHACLHLPLIYPAFSQKFPLMWPLSCQWQLQEVVSWR